MVKFYFFFFRAEKHTSLIVYIFKRINNTRKLELYVEIFLYIFHIFILQLTN